MNLRIEFDVTIRAYIIDTRSVKQTLTNTRSIRSYLNFIQKQVNIQVL